jgi:hypothetical protein
VNDTITAGNAFLAVLRRELDVYLSYRTHLLSQLLASVFSLTLSYYVSRLVHVRGSARTTPKKARLPQKNPPRHGVY